MARMLTPSTQRGVDMTKTTYRSPTVLPQWGILMAVMAALKAHIAEALLPVYDRLTNALIRLNQITFSYEAVEREWRDDPNRPVDPTTGRAARTLAWTDKRVRNLGPATIWYGTPEMEAVAQQILEDCETLGIALPEEVTAYLKNGGALKSTVLVQCRVGPNNAERDGYRSVTAVIPNRQIISADQAEYEDTVLKVKAKAAAPTAEADGTDF